MRARTMKDFACMDILVLVMKAMVIHVDNVQ